MRSPWWLALLSALAVGCAADDGAAAATDGEPAAAPDFEAPVLTNAESPVVYPVPLYEERIEGTVILRLFVSATGEVVSDSTRIAEGSGYPELDSAAVAGVAEMRFAPARRDGRPVATAFLQPVHFRHPARSPAGGQ